jgi:hypothetical protein
MKGILSALGLVTMFLACCPQPQEPTSDVPLGASVPAYDRKEWGRWDDPDKDCQDARQEVLIAESVVPVTFDERGCKVLAGKWNDLYTGAVILDPKVIEQFDLPRTREAGTGTQTGESSHAANSKQPRVNHVHHWSESIRCHLASNAPNSRRRNCP